ncbi:MAG TPA: undecaprenyldiphospho-muramoylpentapeptide beta-N-acetylglucosaminyltransferase [Thermoanaerobaculia bacterium]|nr:undecaprenyldiphospho-muramoylpentapeptide beta-N-acetylglucosaminyltransferase [Thermoanaerobaculia bacterium]
MSRVAGKASVLMIAGGGTGGHIYPAIAIAQEFMARDASRKVIFVGTAYGLESKIVPKAGFPLEFVSVGGLKGKSLGQTVMNLLRLPLGFIQAWRVVGRHKPGVVLGVGGYSSGPVLMAAALRRVPTVIHEANAFPGLTNRLLARFVAEVLVAFPEALPRFGRAGKVTGNPVRKEFFELSTRTQPGEKKRLLVFGGSQGSRILNDATTGALLFLAHMRDRISIVHQTGPGEHEKVAKSYTTSIFSEARVVPYLDPISAEIAAADLVVCRAGAMTIGELAAIGRAAILIPFALATNNHQEINARAVESAGGAVVITEKELTPEKLAGAIGQILGDGGRTIAMGEAARTLARPDATKTIVDIIESLERK